MLYKRIFFFLLLAINFSPAYAQDSVAKAAKPYKPRLYSQEIRLGVSGYTIPFLAERFFSEEKKDQKYIVTSPKSNGAFSFGFSSFINNSWSVGLTFALENISGSIGRNVYDSASASTIFVKSDYRVKAITLLPSLTKYWKQSNMLNLYSGLGVGLSFTSADVNGQVAIGKSEDTQMGISLQLNAFGVRVGNKYAGFAEVGFGNLGLLHLGFSAGF